MANIDMILNQMDELLDNAGAVPFSAKVMVDADYLRDLIDDIRLNIPTEIKQAKAVVADRNEILSMAKKEAENLIRKAEERAKVMVDNDTIVRQANAKGAAIVSEASRKAATMVEDATNKSEDMLARATAKANDLTAAATAKANDTLTQANTRAKEMKKAAYEFSEDMLQGTEAALSKSLEEVVTTRKALRDTARESTRQGRRRAELED